MFAPEVRTTSKVKRLAIVSVLALSACEGKQAPTACGPIAQVAVNAGETVVVTACFTDANEDMLSYAATSSAPAVATVSISGTEITVAGVAPGNASVTVTATDPGGLKGEQSFRVMVPNRAPQPSGTMSPVTVPVGQSSSVDASSYFTEPDGETLVYTAASSDSSVATVSADGGTVTVEALAKGTADVTVTAADPGGLSAAQAFEVTVPNRAPEAGDPIPDMEVFVGDSEEVEVSEHFTDPDGDQLTYAAESSSPGEVGVSVSGSTVTVEAVAQGSAMVTVTASDSEGLDATQTFEVTVPNRGPEAVGEMPDAETFVGESVEIVLEGYFSDPDGDDLAYTATSADEGVATVGVTGATLRVAGVSQGTATVTVTATDPGGLSAEQEFSVTVPNRGPEAVGEMPDAETFVGESVEIVLEGYFSDPDGDDLSYAATSSDEGVATASASGASLTVEAASQGTATVTVTATDPGGLSAEQEFSVTVPNRVPEISDPIPDAEVHVGESSELALSDHFSDPDGDDLSYAATSSDEGVATASASGASLTVEAASQGTATVTVTATDPGGLSAEQSFTVTVPNRVPEISDPISDAEVHVGESSELALSDHFSDPDGDDLSYAAASSDEGVATASVSGASLTVAAVSGGAATVTVAATDPGGLSAEQSFTVTVSNRAPEVSDPIPDAEVHVGETVDVDLSGHFSDPDGDDLSYAAASSDEGVATASVSVTSLTVAAVGQGAATVTVTATDPGGLSAEQSFTVTVSNRAPEVSDPIPDAEVHVGETVDVDLSGHFSDPDGDDLSYAAASSDEGVATASVSVTSLTVAAVGQGAATVTVTATDPGGLSAEQSFTVTVSNRAPEVSDPIPDAEVHVGETVDVDLSGHFADPDGDDLSYAASSSDDGVATVAVTGDTVAVTGVGTGSAEVTVTASDGSLSATQTFVATIVRSDREVLEILYEHTDGDNWTDNTNWLTDRPLDEWYGVGTGAGGRVEVLQLAANNLTGPIPPELGHLSNLRYLHLQSNSLTGPIPPGLGNLSDLVQLFLNSNDLTGPIPPELGDLSSLQYLWLAANSITGPIPPELGNLSDLWGLYLSSNSLAGPIPPELGDLSRLFFLSLNSNDLSGPIPPELGNLSSLQYLWLAANNLAGPIPPELGDLSNLQYLHLQSNSLTGPIPPELGNLSDLAQLFLNSNDLTGPIPPELGDLSSLQYLYLAANSITGPIPPELGNLSDLAQLFLNSNDLTGPIPPELGDLSSLQYLYLRGNRLTGPIPPELGDLSRLLRLHMYKNADLEGELPSSFSSLTSLEEFLAHGTDVCVPETLLDWYWDISKRRAMLCAPPDAYLVQAVQSREDPVPVVADKEALLRVFVTATRTTTETLPPATATFYVDDAETYSVEIDGTSEPIPTEIDEGSLDKSLNVTIPDSAIEEGLSVVIEIDPDSTIDAEILTTKRIPESGELDLGVGGVPDFGLTAIPFLYTADPDSSVIEDVEGMADDEEDHELLHYTYDLLPIEEMDVDDHDPVEINTNRAGFVLQRTRAIRAAESGSGYWMGLMTRFSDVGGVAYVSGTSSASVTNASLIAHELGHNLGLLHAPCGGPRSVDPAYPYEDGSIGAWGYDHRGDSLIDKDEAKDLMTYCRPEWVSDYHFTNAFGHRTVQEMSFGKARSRTGPSLLVWGSRSPSGELSMDPALLVEGRRLLPEARGDYTLTGLDDAQRELFSISFEMDEPADAEEGTGIFVFLLPVEPGWEALATLVLAGPGDAVFTLDGDTEATMALMRDVRSGQVRAIRGDFAERPPSLPGHVVRWSRGVPDGEAWRVMTGRGTGAGP